MKSEYFVCAACGDLLSRATVRAHEDAEETAVWIHAAAKDYDGHEVHPVIAEKDAICDFCTTAAAVWAYEVDGSHIYLGVMDGPKTALSSNFNDSPWGACTYCAGLIDDQQWKKLSIRGLRTSSKLMGHPLRLESRLAMIALHQRFAKSMTGTKVLVVDMKPEDFRKREI